LHDFLCIAVKYSLSPFGFLRTKILIEQIRELMDIQTVCYTPKWHDRLLIYMQSVYPHRNSEYLDWWITNIDNSGSECWDKCLLILGNDNVIIGCTTVNEVYIVNRNNVESFFCRGNTIISPNQRGKGISKEIYNRVNSYNNWISVGITDIAWKIQPKYVRNFTPLQPINVYISFNSSIIKQVLYKCIHKKIVSCSFPDSLTVSVGEEIKRVKDIELMEMPLNGKWSSDEIEFVRDRKFFKKRYTDIYCASRYAIYQYMVENRRIGYVVLRKIVYKGFDMVSLVDYRFSSRNNELKSFKAASRFARQLGIGVVLTLSSRKYQFSMFPLTIMMKKKLNCAVGIKQYLDDFNDALITSADSDLDFVYYK
jgi:hypothetical protein